MNKKVKQVMAIIGLVIIVGMFIVTLVLALSKNPNTRGWFLASIFVTIMVPLIMYICTWLYKLIKKQKDDK